MFCDVVIPGSRLDELTYRFDRNRLGPLSPGDCVKVRLRGRPVKGVVLAGREKSPVSRLLPVEEVIERELVGPELLALAGWMSGYYRATLGEAFGAVLPRGICGYRPRAVAGPGRDDAEEIHHKGTKSTKVEVPASLPDAIDQAVTWDRFGVFCSARDRGRLGLVAGFAARARERGAVLLLLPEAGLRQWAASLAGQFGSDLVEFHSGMSIARRKQAWRRIKAGEHGVVLGVRSAVLAPVGRPGGIVVVDGHDKVYKEERHPRYNARDLAVKRAQTAGCPVLLCDRTPAAETWLNLETGAYQWLEKPQPGRTRRAVFVVDMRRHRDEIFSPRLMRELEQAVSKGTAVLYVNRKGVSRHVVCRECGAVLECRECGVPLVLSADGMLSCGYCGQRRAAPEACPQCKGTSFLFRAPGVEMVAREVEEKIPAARVVRVTGDSTDEFPAGPGTVVVGTRALLFRSWPGSVRLAAAVCFDYDLVLPDFRSRERAFQTLFEMERRAGESGAKLVVQTRRPEDPAVCCAVEHDPAAFMEQELSLREELGFPPYRRLAVIEFHGTGTARVRRQAERVARSIDRVPGAESVGPVEVKRRGRGTVWRLLVKADRHRGLGRVLGRAHLETTGVEARVDVDPLEVV